MKLSEQVLNFELKEKKRYFETWKNENLLNFIEIDHIKKKNLINSIQKWRASWAWVVRCIIVTK